MTNMSDRPRYVMSELMDAFPSDILEPSWSRRQIGEPRDLVLRVRFEHEGGRARPSKSSNNEDAFSNGYNLG